MLFDNFYVDADVSYNGHAFSTAAYATDFIQKMWQTAYGGSRRACISAEGGGFMRNPFGNITAPAGGYIWDYARRAGVSVTQLRRIRQHRRASRTATSSAVEAGPRAEGRRGAGTSPGWDLEITDNKRVDTGSRSSTVRRRHGNLPQLSIYRLGNDHTIGHEARVPTPRAMVAENDLAARPGHRSHSNSVYWKDSAIFILEDDAQSGPDHVDSHRSVLLVASPFAKRGVVDHTFYTTSRRAADAWS